MSGVRHGPVVIEGFPVEVADGAALFGVSNEYEMPSAGIGSARRLDGDLQTFLDELPRYGAVEIEAPPDGAGRCEQLVGIEVE